MKTYSCNRCKHTWYPRIDKRPVLCPACHSPYWDKPRKIKTEKLETVNLIP
jgi:DNA-directed RNA polymerase subunit RPC12/RpoP